MLNVRAPHLVAAFAVLAMCTDTFAENGPPNLIFVLSDDHRADFLGCAGHPVVQTPTLDRLAADGVRFTNGFVTTSICAASRATLFTGLTERSHGFTFGTPPIHRDWVDDSYPARLKANGYRTGFVGKFGVKIDGKPGVEMFDWYRPLNRSPYVKSIEGRSRHVSDLIGDEAIEFIHSTPENEPLCLSVSFNAAHAEDRDKADHYPPPATERELYRDMTVDQPRLVDTFNDLPEFLQRSMNRDRWFWRWDTPAKYEKNVRNYYRMITGLDRNIGRVMEAVEAAGRGDNTVVIFMGDNGYYKGDRGLAGKWSHFEESLRVPLIVFDSRNPHVNEQRLADAISLNLDIAPTLLDYAGIEIPEHYQGSSLRDLASRRDAKGTRDSFTCEHLMNNASIPKWEGMRTPQFTYAKYFEQDPPFEFLHDRIADPNQRKNVAKDPAYAQALDQIRAETQQQLAKQAELRREPAK
ncbi:MAG: sulfatase family protein [Rubripirellula sp.]